MQVPLPFLRGVVLPAVIASVIVSGARASPPDPVPVGTTWSGQYSSVDRAQEFAVQDAAKWEETWKKLRAGRAAASNVPVVDFSKHMVVAVFAGKDSVYSVKIQDVVATDRGLQVQVVESLGGSASPSVVSSPYALRVVPKAEGKVSFVRVRPQGR